MSLAEDHIAAQIVQQKIILVQSILQDLSTNFHFTMGFSLLSKDTHKTLIRDACLNNNTSVAVLNEYLDDLIAYRDRREEVMSLVGNGRVLVLCIDDANQPAEFVSRVQINRCYILNHIYIRRSKLEVGLEHRIYKIKDMDPGPFEGYSSDRFVVLFNGYNQN